MTRKSMIILIAVVAILIAGAFVVMAQDDDTDNTPPFGPGWMHQWGESSGYGFGMMHGGRGMHGGFGQGMMWDDEETMMSGIAEALGLEPAELFTALRDGQTLTEIAATQEVDVEVLYEAMMAQAAAHTSAMVADGIITPEQATEHLTWMRENIAEMPMFTGSGFGPCMGGEAGFGFGMMHGGRHGMYGGRWGNS